jgi:FKBP-type peptidyl-prolyl cis-trans isomerase FkpA
VSLARLVRSSLAAASIAIAAFTAPACTETPTSPSGAVRFAQSDLREGNGNAAATGNVITVHYTGWLYHPTQPDQKGGQFDSSVGLEPFSFTLGAGSVIEGWDRGLVGLKVGGLRRLVIPPSLAYGSVRSGVIPPEATLLFEVELLAVQ